MQAAMATLHVNTSARGCVVSTVAPLSLFLLVLLPAGSTLFRLGGLSLGDAENFVVKWSVAAGLGGRMVCRRARALSLSPALDNGTSSGTGIEVDREGVQACLLGWVE